MTANADSIAQGGAAQVPSLTVAADPIAVRAVGPWLRRQLKLLPADEATSVGARLELAVHEICMNVVDHAGLPPGSSMELSAKVDDRCVEIRLLDRGQPFVPGDVRRPNPGVPQIRGWGLHLAHRLLDSVSYRRDGKTNVWVLRVIRRPTGEPTLE